MKNKNRVLSIISLYVAVTLIYIVLFLLDINNIPLYIILNISSVVVLSTGTVYTVIQSSPSPNSIQKKGLKNKKYIPPKKSINKTSDLIEDYFEAMPLVDMYANAPESYKEIESIDDYIFSVISREDLTKIDFLNLSKMDKIFFLREMLYFDSNERKNLINKMLKFKGITDDKILYDPHLNTINIDDKIRLYVRSLVEPGEKTKILIIDTSDFISLIKEKIGILFDYPLEDFLLSSGGILLEENSKIREYNIDDDDEIALIPSRKVKK
jgi:hypothetical protein